MEDSKVVASAITSLIKIQGMLEVGIEEGEKTQEKSLAIRGIATNILIWRTTTFKAIPAYQSSLAGSPLTVSDWLTFTLRRLNYFTAAAECSSLLCIQCCSGAFGLWKSSAGRAS